MTFPELSILHELASFAEAVAQKARTFVDDVEVFVLRRDVVSFAIENRTLAPEIKLGRLQVGLRAIKGGRLAVAATTSFTVEENISALKAALGASRDSPLASFSTFRAPATSAGFDDGLARFSREPKALQQLAVDVRDRAFDAAKAFSHIESIEGGVRAVTRWLAVATSTGLAASLDNLLAASADVNSARSESEVLRSWPADDAFVRDVGARAVRSFPKRRISPKDLGLGPAAKVSALLDPGVLEGLLRYAAHDHFLASSLATGQTSLEKGREIGSKSIRLVDTGTLRETFLPFDDELTPRGETVLVDGGVFRSFVSSRSSAQRSGEPETGNGFRHPILAEDTSEAPVRDKLGGLAMDPGTRTREELQRAMGTGLVVRGLLGVHGADRARSAFSTTVSDGLAIKDGEVIGHLAPGEWNVAGRVLPGDGEEGLLANAEPSKERDATGSALLPSLLTTLSSG